MKWALFSTAVLIAASVNVSQACGIDNQQEMHQVSSAMKNDSYMNHQPVQLAIDANQNSDSQTTHIHMQNAMDTQESSDSQSVPQHMQHAMVTQKSSDSQMRHQHMQHSMDAGKNNDPHMNHSAMSADNADPHAAHRAMKTQETDIVRSTHDYQVPALVMKNSHGKEVDLQTLLNQDKPVMVNFIFTTCPTICPVLSSTFSIVNKQLGSNTDLNMISISIDPEQDTPTELLKYANKFNADDNWKFITGQLEQSIAMQKAFDIYRGSKMNHVPATFLRASSNIPWTRIEGFASSEELIAEYHKMVH